MCEHAVACGVGFQAWILQRNTLIRHRCSTTLKSGAAWLLGDQDWTSGLKLRTVFRSGRKPLPQSQWRPGRYWNSCVASIYTLGQIWRACSSGRELISNSPNSVMGLLPCNAVR